MTIQPVVFALNTTNKQSVSTTYV